MCWLQVNSKHIEHMGMALAHKCKFEKKLRSSKVRLLVLHNSRSKRLVWVGITRIVGLVHSSSSIGQLGMALHQD